MNPSVPAFFLFPHCLFSLNSQGKLHWRSYLLISSLITLAIPSIPHIIENILPRRWSPAVRYLLVASWLEPLVTFESTDCDPTHFFFFFITSLFWNCILITIFLPFLSSLQILSPYCLLNSELLFHQLLGDAYSICIHSLLSPYNITCMHALGVTIRHWAIISVLLFGKDYLSHFQIYLVTCRFFLCVCVRLRSHGLFPIRLGKCVGVLLVHLMFRWSFWWDFMV